jgi:hypothetical protein
MLLAILRFVTIVSDVFTLVSDVLMTLILVSDISDFST